jgi:L-alanine-DL-glutamate epimerase-like enolase superfamily enzyme
MLTIADARAELWRYPRKPVTPGGSSSMDVLIVYLTSAEGQTGMGFTFVANGRDELPLLAVRSQLEQFCTGKELEHPIALWRRIVLSFTRGVLSFGIGTGPYVAGLTAIDVAAWDLYAKTLGVPIGVAMGGTPRRVPMYGSGGFAHGQDPAEAVARVEEIMRIGFLGAKVRVAGTPHDEKILDAVAERIDGKIDLMMDVNQRGTLSTVTRLLQYAAHVGARFVEEPLPATQHAGFETLSRTSPVPIATGENLHGVPEAAPYLINRWCSVIQPDLAAMGGLTECLRTAQLADHCNVEVAPHFLPGLFVQLAMAVPHVTWLEDYPTIEPLFAWVPDVEPDGHISPPDAPGHGLEFSSDARRDFLIA